MLLAIKQAVRHLIFLIIKILINTFQLSQLTYSRASSDSKLYPETVDSVLPLIKPVSIVITDCFLESEEDDIVDSGQLVKKRRKNSK